MATPLAQFDAEYGEYAEGIATYRVEAVNWLRAEVGRLRTRLRKSQQNSAAQCSCCGGYSLALADGARVCGCASLPEALCELDTGCKLRTDS